MDDPRRRRTLPLLLALVLPVAALASAHEAAAEEKTTSLVDKLQGNPDFRVRVSAALDLGTSDDPKAVQPLCKCLSDKTETEAVRVACAAGLGKLKRPGSDTCLNGATGEKSKKVAEQVATSLKALGGGTPTALGATTGTGAFTLGTCASAPVKGTPKYYVGVDVQNKTSRPDQDVKGLVATEVQCGLLGNGGRFKIASDLDPKKMSATVKKEKLEGYLVTMQVDPIKYESGKLKISMKLLIVTPDGVLKGEIDKWLALSGISKPSKSDEDDLLKKAARWLADRFAELKP